jgi:hypothetical protein
MSRIKRLVRLDSSYPNMIRPLLFAPLLLGFLACNASAEVDEATRKAVIAELGAKVSDIYVFPDKAKQIVERLNAREQSGAYRAAPDLTAFAAMLTEDLRQPTGDKHLGVRYHARPLPPDTGAGKRGPTPEQERQFGAFLKSRNYDIRKVETLPGNIGYIDLRSFPQASSAKPALGALMNLVADTDALIVDLRHNGGGDPYAVAFMSSYLFDKRTHLNDMYWRDGGRTDAFWTEEDVPGKKFGGAKKVYVLTSKKTFFGRRGIQLQPAAAAPWRDRRRNHWGRGPSGRRTPHPPAHGGVHPRRPGDQPDQQDQLGRQRRGAGREGSCGGRAAHGRAPGTGRTVEVTRRRGARAAAAPAPGRAEVKKPAVDCGHACTRARPESRPRACSLKPPTRPARSRSPSTPAPW